MTCKNRTRPSALTSSGSDTQNWYHENGHIARNNAITSTIQAKFAVISRADATTPVRAGDKCQFGVVRTTCVSLVLSGQHVSVWCFPDNMCQFDVVRTTCVNLVLSGEVSVSGCPDNKCQFGCPDNNCQFGVVRTISVSLVALTKG